MSTRRSFRRKVVLALHVVRRESSQKHLAHTLDITETSARLGGLNLLLESGEVIEIKRGAARAKFEVVWMGAPGSSLHGQAGVRILEPGKSIWCVDLPKDQSDAHVDLSLRAAKPSIRIKPHSQAGKRQHERYPCSGSASIKTAGAAFAVHGEVKDISEGGVYVELTSPMPVGTGVTIGFKIEGSWIESRGTVRTSYPLVGMGVAFRELTDANRDKLNALLRKLKQRASSEKSNFVVEFIPPGVPETESVERPARRLQVYPLRVLALACQTLATNFDATKSNHSPADMEELRAAVSLLQQKLSPPPQVQLEDLLTSLSSGSA